MQDFALLCDVGPGRELGKAIRSAHVPSSGLERPRARDGVYKGEGILPLVFDDGLGDAGHLERAGLHRLQGGDAVHRLQALSSSPAAGERAGGRRQIGECLFEDGEANSGRLLGAGQGAPGR